MDSKIDLQSRQKHDLDGKIDLERRRKVDLDAKIGLEGRQRVDLDSKIGLDSAWTTFGRSRRRVSKLGRSFCGSGQDQKDESSVVKIPKPDRKFILR